MPCDLTEDELRQFGQRAAAKHQEVVDHIHEAKDVAKQFKSKISKGEIEITRLNHCINTGQERRDVEVRHEMSRIEGTMTTIRCDTEAVVRVRHLTAEEKQMTINDILDQAYRD